MASARRRQWLGWSLSLPVQIGLYVVNIVALVLAFLAVWEVGPFRPSFSLFCWIVVLNVFQLVTKRDHDSEMNELRRMLAPPTQPGGGTAWQVGGGMAGPPAP